MPLFHLLLVACVQGLTEFLPISSSGHLILLPALTGLDDQGLAIDVAAHVGTLAAVILFFWPDIKIAISGLPSVIRGRIDSQGAWLCLCLIVATIPVVIAGVILKVTGLSDALRSVTIIGWTTIIFGLILYWTDQTGSQTRSADQWSLRHAVTMGLWQVLALIPGTSRSGITISGGRMLGYGREDAARLSMLMSIPTIIASGALLSFDVAQEANWALARDAGIAAVFSAIAAFAALKLMFRLLQSVSFTPYVVYRMVLGAGLLAYAYY
ncbi:undecaprenyl-diphosphate phosphatase [Palleronia caenipelagi]|uniref:Undecaprenyl-diphosphatase n=1 Tax=Palleronia caenipelagi TaxID=2489174 RepID=A0A547Q6R7_9RHOB|nr:undecaprenyl-diphosphate phosphatase [Palleronia caenipelagi]TRD22077.1 undecaprenyl-diphosphate phosphatase [Palleronia caenipelagi]